MGLGLRENILKYYFVALVILVILVLAVLTQIVCLLTSKCVFFVIAVWIVPVAISFTSCMIGLVCRRAPRERSLRVVSRHHQDRLHSSLPRIRSVGTSTSAEEEKPNKPQQPEAGGSGKKEAKSYCKVCKAPSTPSSPGVFDYAELSRADPNAAPFDPKPNAPGSPIRCICSTPPGSPCWFNV